MHSRTMVGKLMLSLRSATNIHQRIRVKPEAGRSS